MKGSKGLVSEVLIVIITVVSSAIVVTTVGPIIDQSRQAQSFSEAKQVIKNVDNVINQLIFEAPGARRSVDVELDSGRFIFSGTEDSIKIRFEQEDISLLSPGTTIEEEGVQIRGGDVVQAYDNGTAYVLENSAVLFVVNKTGSPNNYSFINTTGIVLLIKNKRLGVTVTPKTGIYINDIDASSFGHGFTEPSSTNNVNSAAVRLHMNTTAANYDAVFTMTSSSDFVELEVRNIVIK